MKNTMIGFMIGAVLSWFATHSYMDQSSASNTEVTSESCIPESSQSAGDLRRDNYQKSSEAKYRDQVAYELTQTGNANLKKARQLSEAVKRKFALATSRAEDARAWLDQSEQKLTFAETRLYEAKYKIELSRAGFQKVREQLKKAQMIKSEAKKIEDIAVSLMEMNYDAYILLHQHQVAYLLKEISMLETLTVYYDIALQDEHSSELPLVNEVIEESINISNLRQEDIVELRSLQEELTEFIDNLLISRQNELELNDQTHLRELLTTEEKALDEYREFDTPEYLEEIQAEKQRLRDLKYMIWEESQE